MHAFDPLELDVRGGRRAGDEGQGPPRGVAESFCIVISPDEAGEVERLEILARTNDGFAIAEADLRLRKAGELAGTQQAGDMALIGDIVDDFRLYAQATMASAAIFAWA